MKTRATLFIFCWLLITAFQNRSEASCWFPPPPRFDTIATSPDLVVARTIYSFTDSTLDTISRSEMFLDIVQQYSAADYVFIATADTSFYYIDSSNMADISEHFDLTDTVMLAHAHVDSVIISIQTVLKSGSADFRNGLRLTDVNYYYTPTSLDPISLSSLKGKQLLVFSENKSDYISMFPAPKACTDPVGFYIDTTGIITHEKYAGISIPFTEFLSAAQEVPVRQPSADKGVDNSVVTIRNNRSIEIVLSRQTGTGTVTARLYNLSGQLMSTQTVPVRNSTAIVPCNPIARGLYAIVVSGRDNGGKIFRTPVKRYMIGN